MSKKRNLSFSKLTLKQCCFFLLLLYIVIAICFYFLAGDQLFFRQARNRNVSMPKELASSEISSQFSVTQTFRVDMDEMKSITIYIATYGRENTTSMNVKLFNLETNEIYTEKSISLIELEDSVPTILTLEEPLMDVRNQWFALEFVSLDGTYGNGGGPIYSVKNKDSNGNLYFNSILGDGTVQHQSIDGMLCFETDGMDYVWTGPRYWYIASAGMALLILYFLNVLLKEKKGKNSFMSVWLAFLQKYKFLFEQLINRDFKGKYKRSVLGVFWSFLNPLLTMAVQYVVFSTIFKQNIHNYPLYLLTGIILFNYFNESVGMSMSSIVGNVSLITKVYVPKYIYPITRVLSSAVNLLISLIPLLIMVIATRTQITKAYALLPIILICLIVFCLGVGLALSSSMTFFRDTQFLWGVLSMVWMYATPVFYPEEILPPQFAIVHKINPLYYFLKAARTIVIDGISPEPSLYAYCVFFALLSLVTGAIIFKKNTG